MAVSTASRDPYADIAVPEVDPYEGVAIAEETADPYVAVGAVADVTPPAQETPGTLRGQLNTARKAGLGILQTATAADIGIKENARQMAEDSIRTGTEQLAQIDAGKAPWYGPSRELVQRRIERAREVLSRVPSEIATGVSALAERQGRIEEIPESADVTAYNEAPGFLGKIEQIAKNPIELPTNIAIRGAISSIPSIVLGAAGAATGGPQGAAAGVGAGSFGTELTSTLLDTFNKFGVDLKDEKAVQETLRNPEFLKQAIATGTARGIPIGLLDAFSAGIAGRFVKGAGTGVKSLLKAGAKEAATQATLGGGGEALGQIAAQQPLDPTAILEEVIGELVPGAGEVAQNVIHEQVQNARAAAAADTQAAAAEVANAQEQKQAVAAETIAPVTEVVNAAGTVSSAEELQAQQDKLAAAARETHARRAETALREKQAVTLLQEAATAEQQLEAALAPPVPAIPTAIEELTNAEAIGGATQEAGPQEGLQQETGERLRLRDDAQAGLEAGTGEVLANADPGQVAEAVGLLTPLEETSAAVAAPAPAPAPESITVEPLGKKYLAIEGVGEPVEQYQVKRGGEERGVTMTREELEAAGIPVPGSVAATIAEVAQRPLSELNWAQTEGGQTGASYALGSRVKTQADLEALRTAAEDFQRQSREMLTPGPDGLSDERIAAATPLWSKAQFFREAYEAATNTGSAEGALANPPAPGGVIAPAAIVAPVATITPVEPVAESAPSAENPFVALETPTATEQPKKRGRGYVGLSKRPSGVVDILDAIEQEGGIRPPEGQTGGENDDIRASFKGQAKVLIRKGGLAPDRLAKALFADREAGEPSFGDGTVRTMTDEVERAVDERLREARAYEVEAQRAKLENAIDPEGTKSITRKTETISRDELVVGDKFEEMKTPLEVVDIDADLDAPVVKDGDRFPGEFTLTNPEVRIDSGSLVRNEAGRAAAAQFFEGGTIEEVTPFEEQITPLPTRQTVDPRSGQIELLSTAEGFALTGERQEDAHAALERKLAQRELEAANGLIPGTDKASFAPTRTDRLIQTLESLKLQKPGELFAASPLSLAWDAAIETAIVAIKAGRAIADVITAAKAAFLARFPAATPEDVNRLEDAVRQAAEPPAAAPLNANPADTSSEDLETADAGELADPDQPADPIATQVFGEDFTVNGRRQFTADERTRARTRAEDVFQAAGLPVRWDAQNEVFRLVDPNTPAQEAGKRLLDLTRAELAKGVGSTDPLLSVLINSLRNPDGGLWTSPAFTPSLRNQLFSVSQAEASFYGLMLGALAASKRTLSFVARHIDTVLHKIYSDAYAGDAIGTVMDRVGETARTIADEELLNRLRQTPEGNALLERLRNGIEDPTELETFIAELFRQSGDRLRIMATPDEGLPARIAAMFPTEEWRAQLEKSGGKALESAWWQLLHGPKPDDAGNVQLMDRALQSQLGGLLRETLDRLGLIPKTKLAKLTDEEKLAMALGEGELRRGKIARADAAVRAELDARETKELESVQSIEDEDLRAEREQEIQAKYEELRFAWDEATQQMTEQPASAAMLRRMVNAEARVIFEQTQLSWNRILETSAQTDALKRAVLVRLEKKLRDISARSPANALAETDFTAVSNALGRAFDTIAKDKTAKRDTSNAVRDRIDPTRQAEALIERLAKQQSDTLEWADPQQATTFQVLVREFMRGAMEPGALASRLELIGLDRGVINRVIGVASRQREIVARNAQLERERRAATPREAAATAAAKPKPGLRTLVDAIMNASQEFQNDPAWIEKTSLDHLRRSGLTEGEAKEAFQLFRPELARSLKLAKERALEQVRTGLAPRERQQLGRVKHLWERIQHAVNAGIFDNGPVLEELAKLNGWTLPTAEQRTRMKALADREQELRTLTPAELAKTGPDPQAQKQAQQDKEAATLEERIRLRREMQTLWSRFTRPVTWRTPEGRRNFGAAGAEFLSANMLLKLGFIVKQPFDVLSQAVWHVPSRALAAAAERATNDRAAGRETRYWSDVADSLGDAAKSFRDSAAQAMTQFRQGIRGRGEIRAVEGITPAISLFDRFRQRADEARAAGEPGTAAIYTALGWLRFSLSYARAFDNVNGTLAEVQETRERLITELRLNGRSPEQAHAEAVDIMGDRSAEMHLALGRAKEFLEAEGLKYNKTQLNAAAFEIYKSRQYARMRSAFLDADNIRESNEALRQTVGWNQKEPLFSPGGLIAAPVHIAGRFAERVGLPLPLGRFANAIAIGTNRALTWTPLGFFPGLFGGEENPWFATPKDRTQRRYEAAIGSALGAFFISSALAGMVRVWNRPPPDPEDRDLWEKEGHRPGTVEFYVDKNRFVPVALSSGPFAYLRPYFGGIGELQDRMDNHRKAQRRLQTQAEARGLEAPALEPLSSADVTASVLWGAYQAALGGRTAGGAIRSFTRDDHVPDLKMLAASQVSPLVPGLPAVQEMQRAFGVRIDQAHADFSDLLMPTAGSLNARRNFLGDEINRDLTQQVVQTLTGGTYGVVDATTAQRMRPYRVLSRITWRPAPLGRNEGFEIDGKLRPLSDEEYVKVIRLRGAYLKAGLSQLNEEQPNEDLELDARDVGREAREDALRDGAGARALTLEQVDAVLGQAGADKPDPYAEIAVPDNVR